MYRMKKLLYSVLAATMMLLTGCLSDPELDAPSKPDEPVGPTVMSYDLQWNTSIVDARVATAISRIDTIGHVFHIRGGVSSTDVPTVGSKIIVNTPTAVLPTGLLAKIDNVQPSGDGWDVAYTECGLTDVFEKLEIPQQSLDLESYLVKVLDADGREIPGFRTMTRAEDGTLQPCFNGVTRADDGVITGDKTYDITFPDHSWSVFGLSLTPHFQFKTNLKFVMTLLDEEIKYFGSVADVDCSLGADLSVDLLEAALIDYRKPVLTFIFGAIPVGPLLISPSIDVFFIAKADGKLSLEASVKYEKNVKAKVIYDYRNGFSSKLESEQPGKFSYNFGPKLEGNLGFGGGLGIGLNLYGKALTVGCSLDLLYKETLSKKFNLVEYKETGTSGTYNNCTWGDTELSNSFNTSLHAYCAILANEIEGTDAAELSWPIHTYKMTPEFCSGSMVRDERAGTITVNAYIKNPHLLECNIWGVLKRSLDEPDKDGIRIQFDYSNEKADMLLSQDSVLLTAVVGDLEDVNYYACNVNMTVEGMANFHMGDIDEMERQNDDEAYAAMRMILFDIMKCASGTWDGCNWDVPEISFAQMKAVTVHERDGKKYFKVLIPSTWRAAAGTKLTVGNYSYGMSDFGGWELVFEDSNITAVDIKDEHCTSLVVNNRITDFAMHSELWRDISQIPQAVKSLDLSGSGIAGIAFSEASKLMPTSINLDNCRHLKGIAFQSNSKAALVPYSVVGCDSLEAITITNHTIPNGVLDAPGAGTPLAKLLVENCTLDKLYLSQNFNTVIFSGSKCYMLYVSGNQSLEYLYSYGNSDIYQIAVSGCNRLLEIKIPESSCKLLTVSSCHVLNEIYAANVGYTAFNPVDLPSLLRLTVSNNYSFSDKVPPIFDQVREKQDHVLLYDQRYEYELDPATNQVKWKDNGYGYYYDGEPERGYHLESDKPETPEPGNQGTPSDLNIKKASIYLSVTRVTSAADPELGMGASVEVPYSSSIFGNGFVEGTVSDLGGGRALFKSNGSNSTSDYYGKHDELWDVSITLKLTGTNASDISHYKVQTCNVSYKLKEYDYDTGELTRDLQSSFTAQNIPGYTYGGKTRFYEETKPISNYISNFKYRVGMPDYFGPDDSRFIYHDCSYKNDTGWSITLMFE